MFRVLFCSTIAKMQCIKNNKLKIQTKCFAEFQIFIWTISLMLLIN